MINLLKKRKENAKAKDAITKLNYLKSEVVKGTASEADLSYWDELLGQVEEAAAHSLKFAETAQRYRKYRDVLEIKMNYNKVPKGPESYVVISSIHGDVSLIEHHLKELRQEGDRVVVLGNFLPTGLHEDAARSFITVLMGFAKEGVVFLQGTEEQLYSEKTKNSHEVEDIFMRDLPEEWETSVFIFSDGKTNQLRELLVEKDSVNQTEKFVIGNYNGETGSDPSDYYFEEEKKAIGLPDGFATRLEIK